MTSCLSLHPFAETALSFRRFRRLALMPAALLGISCLPAQAALVGDYDLTGSFANAVSGLGSLSVVQVGTGATSAFTPDGWSWNNINHNGITPDGWNPDLINRSSVGLKLAIPEPAAFSAYSIGMVLQLSEVTKYVKLMDFQSRGSDNGIYAAFNGISAYFDERGHDGGQIAANTPFTVIVTRHADRSLAVYLNGNSAPVITVLDDKSTMAFGNELHFLLDDATETLVEYSPSGTLSQIRIWDSALSPDEIPNAMVVPEASTLGLLLAAAVAGVAWTRVRRKTA